MKNDLQALTLAAATALIALSPFSANAAQPPLPAVPKSAFLKNISDCRAITDPTQRLACFDKAAASLDQAQTSGDVVVVDRQQVGKIKHQAFGFNVEALSIFDRLSPKGSPDTDTSITAVARQVKETADGKWIITLDDGAVWRQIDSDSPGLDPHVGSKIHIRRASMGSFLMTVDGQSSIRVHRDE